MLPLLILAQHGALVDERIHFSYTPENRETHLSHILSIQSRRASLTDTDLFATMPIREAEEAQPGTEVGLKDGSWPVQSEDESDYSRRLFSRRKGCGRVGSLLRFRNGGCAGNSDSAECLAFRSAVAMDRRVVGCVFFDGIALALSSQSTQPDVAEIRRDPSQYRQSDRNGATFLRYGVADRSRHARAGQRSAAA
jgi:hypothetical protein